MFLKEDDYDLQSKNFLTLHKALQSSHYTDKNFEEDFLLQQTPTDKYSFKCRAITYFHLFKNKCGIR